MDSVNKTNDFKVLVEIYESKHKFVISGRHQKWPKLKKSIENRINQMIGAKIDFKNHLFKVFDESTKTFIVLDQTVYNYFRRLPELYVLVANTEDIKRKPNDNELKKWKNTKSSSEMIVSDMNALNLLNCDERQEIEELLAKTVRKLVNKSNINWNNVSQEMIINGYEDFDPKLCKKEFQRLVDKYLNYLDKCDVDSEPDNNWKPFEYLNGIDFKGLLKTPKKKSQKINESKQKSEFGKQKHKNTVNCDENGSKSNKKTKTGENTFNSSAVPNTRAHPLNWCLMESRLSTEPKLIRIPNTVSTSDNSIDWFMNSTSDSKPNTSSGSH